MISARRIVELESLRGLLALWVVLGHLLTASGFDAEQWAGPLKLLARGTDAVDVFVILSGFVIWDLLDRGGEGYAAFIVRRAFRLYPVYLLCLAAAILSMPLAVEALRALPWADAHNAARLQIFADSVAWFPAQLVAHLTLLHGLLPDSVLPSSPYAFAGQAWSISLEWQFYLVAPLLFALVRRSDKAWLLVLGAALALHFLAASWPPSALPPKLILFVVGMLSQVLWKQRSGIPPSYVAWLLPTGVLLALLCRSAALLVWALVFASLLAVACDGRGAIERGLSRLLSLRVLRWLGECSYGLYLCHMVVLYLLLRALTPWAAALGQGGHFAVLLALVPAASVLLAWLLHRWVEQPGIRLGKTIVSCRQPAWAAATFNPKQRGSA